MKILSYLLIGLVLIFSGIHATLVEDLINQQVSTIINRGVQKNIIPHGTYYLSALSTFEELNKNNKTEFRVTAVIKNLNNRTKISFSGLFNEDLNSISYLYNYSFFNGAKSLSSNLDFYWLDYASSINSTYCPPQDFSEDSYRDHIRYLLRNIQDVSFGNLNTSNSFQDLMDYALSVTQGNYPPQSQVWSAPSLFDFGFISVDNYIVLTYIFTISTDGDYYWDFKVEVMYQPCSGHKNAIYIFISSDPDDWRDSP